MINKVTYPLFDINPYIKENIRSDTKMQTILDMCRQLRLSSDDTEFVTDTLKDLLKLDK